MPTRSRNSTSISRTSTSTRGFCEFRPRGYRSPQPSRAVRSRNEYSLRRLRDAAQDAASVPYRAARQLSGNRASVRRCRQGPARKALADGRRRGGREGRRREHTAILPARGHQRTEAVERAPPIVELAPEDRHANAAPVLPPPDPLGVSELEKSHSFTIASAVNSLTKVALRGGDAGAAIEGWGKVVHQLHEAAGPVLEWLRAFAGS